MEVPKFTCGNLLFLLVISTANANDYKLISMNCSSSGKTITIERCDHDEKFSYIIYNITRPYTKVYVSLEFDSVG